MVMYDNTINNDSWVALNLRMTSQFMIAEKIDLSNFHDNTFILITSVLRKMKDKKQNRCW